MEALVDAVAEFGTAVGESVGKNYNVDNSRAERFLKDYMSERIGLINGTTRRALVKALENEEDPVGAVRAVFDHARDARARMIAESEVVRASNWATIDAGKWVAELDFKSWASQQDPAVRDTHQELDGQVVAWNDDFEVNGFRGAGPGMMSGGPEMNANCRCAALPARVGQQRKLDEYGDPVALFDDVRRPFVSELTAAWRRVFDEQEAAVLAELM